MPQDRRGVASAADDIRDAFGLQKTLGYPGGCSLKNWWLFPISGGLLPLSPTERLRLRVVDEVSVRRPVEERQRFQRDDPARSMVADRGARHAGEDPLMDTGRRFHWRLARRLVVLKTKAEVSSFLVNDIGTPGVGVQGDRLIERDDAGTVLRVDHDVLGGVSGVDEPKSLEELGVRGELTAGGDEPVANSTGPDRFIGRL